MAALVQILMAVAFPFQVLLGVIVAHWAIALAVAGGLAFGAAVVRSLGAGLAMEPESGKVHDLKTVVPSIPELRAA
jgi:hypothetical protein